MKWTEENNKQLLLIMLSPNMVPNKHKGAIAKTFRGMFEIQGSSTPHVEVDFDTEHPSEKAVQEQMAKLREANRALLKATQLDKEFGDVEGKGKKRATSFGGPFRTNDEPAPGTPATTTSSTGPIASDPRPMPVINNGDEIFDGFPLTWSDLSEDVRKQVRNACDRRKQKLDRDAQVPGWTKMHERNYEKQLAREAKKAKEAEEETEGPSNQQTATNTPDPQLGQDAERAKKAGQDLSAQEVAATMIEFSKRGKGKSIRLPRDSEFELKISPEKDGSITEQTIRKNPQAEKKRQERERADMVAKLTGALSAKKPEKGGGSCDTDEEMEDAPTKE